MKKKSTFHYDRKQPPSPEKRIAFCRFHKWHLTVRTVKIKGCLTRSCCAFFKNKKHPYWAERAEKKRLREEHGRDN